MPVTGEIIIRPKCSETDPFEQENREHGCDHGTEGKPHFYSKSRIMSTPHYNLDHRGREQGLGHQEIDTEQNQDLQNIEKRV